MTKLYYRPTWAEIDLSAIRYNLSQIKKQIDKGVKVLVAVKANAYGHGISEVSDTLIRSGVDYLGVGTTDEAISLRRNGFKIPVLILGSILSNEIEPVIKNKITQAVGDMQLASIIDRYAQKVKRKAKIHIKIDVGMGRIGIWHKEALNFIREAIKLNNIEIEGIFSHFPSADEDISLTRKQIKNFSSLIDELQKLDIDIPYKHMANSAALIDYKESHMNLVRPGLMVYGLSSALSTSYGKIKLKPALSLKSRVVFVKDAPPGRRISYGGTYTTTCHTRVATVAIGYGDGFSRRLSNKGSVLIKGRKVPILGRVCMDQIMVDAGRNSSIKVGDEVVLIGRQGKQNLTVEEIAKLCDTIPYEVACWFGSRVPRIYKR